MNDDANPLDAVDGDGGHLFRWLALIALALLAVAAGRQIALGSADRKFEARLAELDENRD